MNTFRPDRKAATVLAFLFAFTLYPIPYTLHPVYAAFEDLGLGARVPGMGNAFVAVADDVSSVYYNPAGLSFVERPKAMASHSILYSGLNDGSNLGLTNLALAFPLLGGRAGSLGFLWNQFSLSGVYTERTLQASYGLRLAKNTALEKFAAGASVKYLTHSFSRLEESYNAVESGLNQYGNADPVLMGNNSKSALDLDAGIVYNLTKKYTIGAAVMNILQADAGFASRDPIPMKTRVGASYKSLWMVMTAEAKMQKGPDGSLDKNFIFAAEKVFPSLDRGDVGVRASLGAGDRDFRQVTAGLSYKIAKIQFDYGFSMPLGTIKETIGNHRLAMLYHFGSPTSDEQYAAQLLGEYRQLRERPDYTGSRSILSLNDPRIKEVKALLLQESYYTANRALMDKAADLLPDPSAINLTRRLGLVAAFYPSLPRERRTRAEEALSGGIQHYLRGNDGKAVKLVNYAQADNQQDTTLSNFLDKLEETTHLKADRVPSDFNRGYTEYKFHESDMLYSAKKYEDALKKLRDILEFEPENILALKKAGSCNYLLNDYAQARRNWEEAARKETDPAEKEKLAKMVSEAAKKGAGRESWEPPGGEARVAQEAEKPPSGDKKSGDAREIEKLYQAGADYYTKGDYGRAADAFRKILTLDPENSPAKKALERIIRLSR